MKNKKKLITVLTVILVSLIGILVVCMWLKKEDSSEKQPADTVAIDTPYGALYYPDKWKDSMITEVDETKGYVITFVGEIHGNKVRLFSISFGESESMQIGTLITKENEEIPVGSEFFTLEETMDWAQKDVDMALEMRDAGNDLLNYLMERESFKEN